MQKFKLIAALTIVAIPLTASANDLAIHWTFDELGPGGEVPDQAPADGLQDGGPVLGSGITIDNVDYRVGSGAAYFVNDSGDEILWQDVGNPVASGTDMTMAYWFRTNSGGTRTQAHAGQGGTIYHRVKAINLDSETPDRELRMTARGPGDGELNDNGSTNIRDDQWHHIAYVASGIPGADRQIYLDGQLEITGSAPLADTFDVEHVGIGGLVRSNLDIVDHLVESWVDDFQLYSGALSAGQIQHLSNNPGATIPEPAGVILALAGVGCVGMGRIRRGQTQG